MTIAIPDLGVEFTFTNNTQKPFVANQLGIPRLAPGESISLFENKLRPGHFDMVALGRLSVSPDLPPDLVERARSMNWQDGEFRKVRDIFNQMLNKIEFDSAAVAVASVDALVEIEIWLLDTNGVLILTDSEEEVDISVDVGTIEDVTGGVSGVLGGTGPIRAKFASGKITVVVTYDTAAAQTISLASSSSSLTVTDTHVITYS